MTTKIEVTKGCATYVFELRTDCTTDYELKKISEFIKHAQKIWEEVDPGENFDE